jgi:predicted AAA+ superfamily ATPase
VIYNPGQERDILNEITQSYLFKDILVYGNIKKPEILEKILRALAFQVGSEVSYNEIAQLTGVDKKTVANYIHLLTLSCLVRQKYNGFFKLFDTTPQKWLTAKRLELAITI